MIKIINNEWYLKIDAMDSLEDAERLKNQLLHLLSYAVGFGDAEREDLISINALAGLIKDMTFSPQVIDHLSNFYNKNHKDIDIKILEDRARLLEIERESKQITPLNN